MRFGVLGTGIVGRTLAGKLAELEHEVVLGSRDPSALSARTEPEHPGMQSFAEWYAEHSDVELGTFDRAASHVEIIVAATNGMATMDVLEAAGRANLAGKAFIDVTNPLDFSQGMPPSLFVSNTDSLAERIQRAYPDANVVKSLNTVSASVMVDPGSVGNGAHTAFVSGNDAGAKETVTRLLGEFGWKDVIDLGDITAARGLEMYLPLWFRLMGTLGTPMFNVALVR